MHAFAKSSEASIDVHASCSHGSLSLISNLPWDAIRLEQLLPLKDAYPGEVSGDFLLRHYWIPATSLTFRQSCQLRFPDGRSDRSECVIEREMVRCRSNECLWRERVFANRSHTATNHNAAMTASDLLCLYDRCQQTFRSGKAISPAPLAPTDNTEAGRFALSRLPILLPPGPMPLGSSWENRAGGDYMQYQIDTEGRVGNTSVLLIRRSGVLTIQLAAQGVLEDSALASVERQGVTVFAWNRGLVLEDRFLDRPAGLSDQLTAGTATERQVITRLVRSSPPAIRRE